MRTKIKSADKTAASQTHRLLQFMLAPATQGIDEAQIDVDVLDISSDTVLYHCRVELSLCDGRRVRTEELQSSTYVAVSRALARSLTLMRFGSGAGALEGSY